ncbi:MAG: TetR/AcrR family transcriptional regulator [Solirubrobacterales bacterium]|nr:TetR/AcrR family transcriptional regulator [Solirubrobacterales bacterium]
MLATERRAARRIRLLDAGLDLLGTVGLPATTVRAVCRKAELTTRYFYESFNDVDELIVAVFDRAVEQTAQEVVAAIAAAPADYASRARAAIQTGVMSLTDDPRRARVVLAEGLGNPALLERRGAALAAFTEITRQQVYDLLDVADADDAFVQATAHMLMGGFTDLMISHLAGALPHARDQLIDDMTDLLVMTGEGMATVLNQRQRSKSRRRAPPRARPGSPGRNRSS